MIRRKNIGSFIIITAVTVLIWWWAAGETREQGSIAATVIFDPADPERWIVNPPDRQVTLKVDGARIALREARVALKAPLVIDLGALELPTPGTVMVNLVDVLANHPRIREERISISSTEPPAVEITVDEIVRRTVPIEIVLPSEVQTVGEKQVEPTEVVLIGPNLPEDTAGVAVETVVDPGQLTGLEPGLTQTLEVRLRHKGLPVSIEDVTIEPSMAKITFTVRSRTRQHTLPTVRVHLDSAPENTDEYSVQINEADNPLRDVTITADDELIRRIESGEVKVFAVVYLSTTDFEQHITSKNVAYFVTDTWEIIPATVGESLEPPEIGLTITERPGN